MTGHQLILRSLKQVQVQFVIHVEWVNGVGPWGFATKGSVKSYGKKTMELTQDHAGLVIVVPKF